MKTKPMKILLSLEEFGVLILTMYLFSLLTYPWWVYPLLLFIPDLSILGYMINPVAGAYLYNFIHHRGIAIILYIAGVLLNQPLMALLGLMLLAHSTLDRVFGYGLKHKTGFNDTHMGRIGKE